jgi:hypothetical protein
VSLHGPDQAIAIEDVDMLGASAQAVLDKVVDRSPQIVGAEGKVLRSHLSNDLLHVNVDRHLEHDSGRHQNVHRQ